MLIPYTLEQEQKLATLGHIAAGYFTASVPTTVISAGTYYKVNATFIETKTNGFVWNDTLKRWDYSGPDITVGVFAACTGSHDDAQQNHEVEWKVHKNGSPVASAPSGANIDKAKSNSISIIVPAVDVVDGDYIEVYATSDEDGNIVYTKNMNFTIR